MRNIGKNLFLAIAVCLLVNVHRSEGADADFSLSWKSNVLRVASPQLPTGALEIWYLEAFCRSGAHTQSWDRTKIPHRTTLLHESADHKRLEFETTVADKVLVHHDVVAEGDSIKFSYTLKNTSAEPFDLQWFQPTCIRVADFTRCNQKTFTAKSFVFTEKGLTPLSQTARTTNALYLGGQVYLPKSTKPEEANPRPISENRVTNGLIGCISADGSQILATASSTTHELFEGIYVCLHSDPFVGGLAPGETKTITSRLYLLPNDPRRLLKRYLHDFADHHAP
jgi:hypothetical protein